MDEYAEIYWLDERNATVVDHRRPTSGANWAQNIGQTVAGRPGTVSIGNAPVRTQPAIVRYPNGTPGRQVVIASSPERTMLGGLAIGQIIEMATQLLAALQPLPAPPVATADVAKDVGNLVLYQTALAGHAKRDEQLRTLGSLVGTLVK